VVLTEDGQPFTKSGLHMSVDGKPLLDKNHRLLLKWGNEKVSREEFVQKKGPSEIQSDMTISDGIGDIIMGRDGLPVTKGEVALGPNGDFLLDSDGRMILIDELQVGDDGTLLAPNQLPVTEMRQKGEALKTSSLMLNCRGFPVFSKDGMLVYKNDVMQVGHVSVPRRDVTIASDDTLCGPDGQAILGEDGYVLTKGEVLMGHDDKPLLTSEGKPIMQHDLMFSGEGALCIHGGEIIRNRSDQPFLRKNIYTGNDGRPRLNHDGKVIEMKDVLRSFEDGPLFGSAFKEPITRTDLKFSDGGELMGLGSVIRRKDGTPYMRGEVLMDIDRKPMLCEEGHVVTVVDVIISPRGSVLVPGPFRVPGSTGKPLNRKELLLDANGCPQFTMGGRLMELDDLVYRANGDLLVNSEKNAVARTDLTFASDGKLTTPCGTVILGNDGLPIMNDEVLTGRDGKPVLPLSGQA